MTDAPEQQKAESQAPTSTTDTKDTAKPAPGSPTQSDKSSDSEGKDVREKLKDTQIHAPATSDPVPASDQVMNDVANGNAKPDQSASGSDSERGRLRRKRSREDFEDEAEGDKHPEKKTERHARKRSRDITKDLEAGVPVKPAANAISSIQENEADEQMTSPAKDTSATVADKASSTDTSPKNKRTHDQVEKDAAPSVEASETTSANGKPVETMGEERDTKRSRDQDGPQPATDAAQPTNKMPPGSGFAKVSAASPFAAMSPKPQAPKSSDKTDSLPQTSDDKFKSSGFGSFASSSASPFGGLAAPKANSSSPFGSVGANKLSSFAGNASSSTDPAGGFGALGGSSTSTFGGSSFGASSGSGFAGLGSTKSALFPSAPGALEIKGLKSKETPFGAAALGEASDDEEGGEPEGERDASAEERQSSQPLLSQQPHETGEEGEVTAWTGRTQLYTMAGEGSSRSWKERGTGTFKINISEDEPKKARFVLRAEGTHRLLLNAAVTKNMVFGGDAQGQKPKDTRLLFNSATSEGVLEMHLLKLKAENAVKLWEEVTRIQESEL